MKRKLLWLIPALLVAGLFFYRLVVPAARSETMFAMNTMVQVEISGSEQAFDHVKEIIVEESKQFDPYLAGSALFNLNESGKAQVPERVADCIQKAITVTQLTGRGFTITVKPLKDLWGVTTDSPRVPSPEEIRQAVEKIDDTKVQVEGNTVTLHDGVQVDLGGVAKGYLTDVIVQQMKQDNVRAALLDLGGNVYAFGKHPFQIGIQKPFAPHGEAIVSVQVQNQAVVTSGVYERYFEVNGKQYHHIFDPQTGYPADTGIQAVTVVSPSGTLSDILSTALLVMGEEEARKLLPQIPNAELMLVKQDKILVTKGLAGKMKLLDSTYTVELL